MLVSVLNLRLPNLRFFLALRSLRYKMYLVGYFAQKVLHMSSIVVLLLVELKNIKISDHITEVVTKKGQAILIIHRIQKGLCVIIVISQDIWSVIVEDYKTKLRKLTRSILHLPMIHPKNQFLSLQMNLSSSLSIKNL